MLLFVEESSDFPAIPLFHKLFYDIKKKTFKRESGFKYFSEKTLFWLQRLTFCIYLLLQAMFEIWKFILTWNWQMEMFFKIAS